MILLILKDKGKHTTGSLAIFCVLCARRLGNFCLPNSKEPATSACEPAISALDKLGDFGVLCSLKLGDLWILCDSQFGELKVLGFNSFVTSKA
ncbi:unnamed protein product [Cuscuta campestris]|uniref:Uncharacterized protein n=1 Tax=Cuscuta campestris TaxID=132261 RepID=A0A484NKA9_9ASTE|nr:unnamed protein product [Cuscuta campestris]